MNHFLIVITIGEPVAWKVELSPEASEEGIMIADEEDVYTKILGKLSFVLLVVLIMLIYL